MDMHSREQYLDALREEYLRAGKKQKTRLLNEALKRIRLNRKVRRSGCAQRAMGWT
jgi:hypothetical protein